MKSQPAWSSNGRKEVRYQFLLGELCYCILKPDRTRA